MYDILPIFLSVVSVAIAATALGWNIYRDVYSKARVMTHASCTKVHTVATPPMGPFLDIAVTNMGPGTVNLQMIVFRNVRPWYKLWDRSGGVILYDWTNPLSAKLPHKLEPGEKIDLFLPWSDQDPNLCIFLTPFSRLGVNDSFGRSHWVPNKEIRNLRRKFAKNFPAANYAAEG